MIGVAWRGTVDDYQDFTRRHGLGFVQVDDSKGRLFAAFGVPSQPAYARVGADGSITTYTGTLSEEGMLEFARG